jgi:arylsulfatase A-like enzyme
MNRRSFLTACLTTLGGAALAAQQKCGPNIVWLMADDLGWGDVGCNGQKWIRTPNIDRLAAEGMRFTDAYAGCTVCAPGGGLPAP